MYELRQILVRMRLGDSDRALAKAGLIGRPKAKALRRMAEGEGWLDPDQGRDVLFTSLSKLLGDLHAARATDSFERKFQNLVKVPLLIIDDFGLKPLRVVLDGKSYRSPRPLDNQLEKQPESGK